jgi:hypothetical protein
MLDFGTLWQVYKRVVATDPGDPNESTAKGECLRV